MNEVQAEQLTQWCQTERGVVLTHLDADLDAGAVSKS
jgi:hypothetical protein